MNDVGLDAAKNLCEALINPGSAIAILVARIVAEVQNDARVVRISLGAQPIVRRERVFLAGKDVDLVSFGEMFDSFNMVHGAAPDTLVLADGTLAHSSGPVRDPSGKLIARFNSVWRLEAPGTWRIVFDRGESVAP